MYNYRLGLRTGGLPEDEGSGWEIKSILSIKASDLREAKDLWAKETREDKSQTWNPEYQTVWGWSIMVLSTDDPNVDKSDFF